MHKWIKCCRHNIWNNKKRRHFKKKYFKKIYEKKMCFEKKSHLKILLVKYAWRNGGGGGGGVGWCLYQIQFEKWSFAVGCVLSNCIEDDSFSVIVLIFANLQLCVFVVTFLCVWKMWHMHMHTFFGFSIFYSRINCNDAMLGVESF